MAIFGFGKSTVDLGTGLISKGAELRESERANADNEVYFLDAATRAAAESKKNARHAAAVEQAVKILTDAGVEL